LSVLRTDKDGCLDCRDHLREITRLRGENKRWVARMQLLELRIRMVGEALNAQSVHTHVDKIEVDF